MLLLFGSFLPVIVIIKVRPSSPSPLQHLKKKGEKSTTLACKAKGLGHTHARVRRHLICRRLSQESTQDAEIKIPP